MKSLTSSIRTHPRSYLLVVVIASAWITHVWSDSAWAENRRLYRAHFIPPLITGLLVPYATYSRPAADSADKESADKGSDGRRLIMAMDDQCRFCGEEINEWHALLDKADLSKVSVIVVSFGGMTFPHDIASRLQPRRVPMEVRVVSDRTAFVARTGIVSTPYTVLVDGQGAVIAAVTRLNAHSRSLMTELIER